MATSSPAMVGFLLGEMTRSAAVFDLRVVSGVFRLRTLTPFGVEH